MTIESLHADEAIAVRLMQAIRADAEAACAPDALDLVSVTLDLSATAEAPGDLVYTPRLCRRPGRGGHDGNRRLPYPPLQLK